jgi:PIN domain nuclease of toxin-antitoxin system
MYLLDTHVLLWASLDPDKLSNAHQLIISDPGEQKVISTISVWEISLKYSTGKLDLGMYTPEEFLHIAEEEGFQVVGPSPEVFASFYKLGSVPGHKDPFDRILIWQALQDKLTLLSHDGDFPKYKPKGLKLI